MTARLVKKTEEYGTFEPKFEGSLDDLPGLSEDKLDQLFLKSPSPSLEEVNGPHEGRVLAAGWFPLNRKEGLDLINQNWLPWKGKVFTPLDPAKGRGKNRMRLGQIWGEDTFDFESRIEPSLFGGGDCYVLDYDLTGNALWLRPVRDEMKKIQEGLYLGRALYRIGGEHQFVLYFALRQM